MKVPFPELPDRLLVQLQIPLVLVLLLAVNVVTGLAQDAASKAPAPGTTPTVQKPAAKDGTPQPITGKITGHLSASDGQPLLSASVVVQSLTGMPAAKPTRPDAEGRFVFDDLVPGAYLVVGTAPGYIDQSMSLGSFGDWPRHLIGSDVKVNMIRGGVITGLLTNAKGEPMVGVPVHATVTNVLASSLLSYIGGGSVTETDDRGVYRIYGLLPGQYTVNAGGKGPFGQFTPSGFDLDAPTYYPSTSRDTAVPVSVRSGDETTGVDIKYRGGQGHSISGVVLGNITSTAATGAVTVMLAHAGTASIVSMEFAATADPRRAFSFNGVADGEYDLLASYLTNPNDNALIGGKRVTVRGDDLAGVELNLVPLGSVAGTILLDPIKPEDKCDKRGSQVIETVLRLPRDETRKAPAQPLMAMYSGLGQLNDKGEFTQRNLGPGRYRLDIELPSNNWYVRAITLAASATRVTPTASTTTSSQRTPATPESAGWQGTLTLKSGEALSGVSIMVGQDAAVLRGRAAPEGSVVAEGTSVHLVPADREQANNVLRYSQAIVKRDGSFVFTNMAPGRYFILSRVEPSSELDASPRPVAWDPVERAKLRRQAEAAKTEVELKPCQAMTDYLLK
jgi:hypothetical protein